MTLDDLLYDIHVLEEEMRNFERKYGVRTENLFFEAYDNGEEPVRDDWVQDWAAWASAYQIWRRLRTQYYETIQPVREQTHSISGLMEKRLDMNPFQSLRDYELQVYTLPFFNSSPTVAARVHAHDPT